MAEDRIRTYISEVNKTFGGEIAELGGKFSSLKVRRFSSGIASLDVALGGGWPFGRIAIIAGEYSTGKTAKAIKACCEIENYDHLTHLHKDYLVDKPFQPGAALVVDIEGAFDLEWAEAHGFNKDLHVVARPEYSEQAIDLVTTAIRDNVFDLIVVDSIAAMTPSIEIEESAEKQQMGVAARLVNKAMRRWCSSLVKASQTSIGGGPLLLCLNQFRINIGQMFGDPRVLPGGKGQVFAASIIAYTKSAKLLEDSSAGSYGGIVHKNKTYRPRINFEYDMQLKTTAAGKKGEVDNLKFLIKCGVDSKLIGKEGRKLTFTDITTANEEEMINRLTHNQALKRKLWRSVLQNLTGSRW